ncbi:hypothetical protein I551_4082 [Mycobacterium ulcerans str. Harvey]|uniref:Uncharacterized protein n=1 Tax=Mycobacterium ulcerans str. Harvey TaxID=1299332 RepID=A0ABP3AE48_MYCUL|nr:hypothetical protein I551_4082 [Mycobacterium ulcerans str. Harvey]
MEFQQPNGGSVGTDHDLREPNATSPRAGCRSSWCGSRCADSGTGGPSAAAGRRHLA